MTIASQPTRSDPAGPQFCAAIAETMIGHLLTRLELEARATGGVLTVGQIAVIAARFVAEQDRYRDVLRRSYEECGRAREAAAWEQSRKRPFDRMLVKRFAHLFPARSGDDGGSVDILSRRMIPGVNLAVTMMLGPDLYSQCQRKAQAIVERLRAPSGSVDWSRVHRHPDARSLVNDVLVVVAHYFVNFEKRRDWFILLVNGNLTRASASAADAHWELTPALFHQFMRALFADLEEALGKDGGAALRTRHGAATVETLNDFLKRLKQL